MDFQITDTPAFNSGSLQLAAAWLDSLKPTAAGLITSEGSGFGDARTMQPGKALDLNGIDQYGLADNATGWPINGEPRTFCGWVRQTNTTGQIFCYGNTNSFKRWSVVGGANLRVEIQGGGYSSSTLPPVNDGEWHFVAVVLEETGGTIGDHTLYVDDQSETASGTTNLQTETTQQPTIGKILVSSSQFLEGSIFDLRFYNKALTADELTFIRTFGESGTDPTTANLLAQWHLEGNGLDSSGNENHLTFSGSPTDYIGSDVPHSFLNSEGYNPDWIKQADNDISGYSITTGGAGSITITDNVASFVNCTPIDDYIASEDDTFKRSTTQFYRLKFTISNYVSGRLRLFISGSGTKDENSEINEYIGNGYFEVLAACSVNASENYFTFRASSSTTTLDLEIHEIAEVGTIVPALTTDKTKDVYGNDLQYSGQQPPKAQVENSACLTFNGTQYVTGDVISGDVTTLEFETYFKAEYTGSTQFLLDFRDDASTGLYVGILSTGVLYVSINATAYSTGFTATDELWHQLNVAWDGDTIYVTIDGETTTYAYSGVINITTPWHISSRSYSVSNQLHGEMCNISFSTNGTERFNFPCADGSTANTGVTQVTDRVSGNQYTIQNHTVGCWANTQNVFHSNTVNGFSWDGSARIPPSLSDPTVDAIAGQPLTNPPGGLNGSESTINFCEEPLAPLFNGRNVPGDGVLANYSFDGDPGDLSIGIDTARKEARFTLARQ